MTRAESAKLERALLSLRIISTWARCELGPLGGSTPRPALMRDIANMAAKGLGRKDLIGK